LKKYVLISLLIVLIAGAWFLPRLLSDGNDGGGDDSNIHDVADDLTSDDDLKEQERLLAEKLEAERLEAERLEAERLAEEQRIAEEIAEAERTVKRDAVLEESKLLFRGYFYDEAIALLNEDEELISHETESLEAEIREVQDGLVRFDGDIKHIFFHSLILYPEHLFPNLSVPTGGYNEGFAFQSELFAILPQLLERGYVLYDINAIFSKDADGIMRQNDIYLPHGKRPLVLSIDDPSYHYGQRYVSGGFDRGRTPGAGFANRIILDENGELATEVITPEGETIITYDGDVHIVIDAFVKEHPEFSFRGNKGIIATTGYMGIFGYDLRDLQNEDIRSDVIAICDKFKENGWLFANHSYTHNRVGFWGPESQARNIRYDVGRWHDLIEPVVGSTNIFIAPFGFLLRGEAMQVILDNGYDIYCTVDFSQSIFVYDTHAVMGRIEIGGYTLVRQVSLLERDFFDVASVIDPHRPPIISR
jgi:hypothetical protein